MKQTPNELLLTPAAEYAGVTRHRILLLVAKGQIRSRIIGDRVFVETRDLDRLRDGQR